MTYKFLLNKGTKLENKKNEKYFIKANYALYRHPRRNSSIPSSLRSLKCG